MKNGVQKYSREKITKTQYTQILLSHNIDYFLKEYIIQKYKLFFFCWDTMAAGLYFFFLTLAQAFLFFLLFLFVAVLPSWSLSLPHDLENKKRKGLHVEWHYFFFPFLLATHTHIRAK
jgi:hypothetical protein